MKVLIVEDEYVIAEGVALTIQMAGHEVTAIAEDLAGALSAARQTPPDMAFVDIKLANGSNGLEVARELTAMGIVCVFATGNPPDPLQARGLGLGYIVKPFPPKLLMQTTAFIAQFLTSGRGAGQQILPHGFVRL